jgi:hypothetical protein
VSCSPLICSSESIIQRWTGTRWIDVDHPLAVALSGVHVVAADDVWAVGTNSIGTVIQHWDGTAWTYVPSPDPEDGGELDAIDGMGADELWASGAFLRDDFEQRTVTDPLGGCDPQSAQVTIVANQTTVKNFRLDC